MRRPNQGLTIEEALAAWNVAQQRRATDDALRARCELITPMYGGGVAAGEVDVQLPIRPSALRGQLRFWWRLINDQGQGAPALFAAESALWGGITGQGPRASLVTLQVIAKPIGDERLSLKSRVQHFPDYALILDPGADPRVLPAGYAFELVLRFDPAITSAKQSQVIESLRWWASFGGVGARTRRGLGAVKVGAQQPSLSPITSGEVAALGGRLVLGKRMADAASAWKAAVESLRRFRQGPNVGRNPGQRNHPGRSRWPEPDAIRRFTGRNTGSHAPEHSVDGFYPRAAFGLPVIFHFKDPGDPQDQTLEPAAGESGRMASPLILRPYFDGGSYRPAALLLPGWTHAISVPVRFGNGAARPAWPTDAVERQCLAAQIKPMQGHGTDVLSAFMDYFGQENQ